MQNKEHSEHKYTKVDLDFIQGKIGIINKSGQFVTFPGLCKKIDDFKKKLELLSQGKKLEDDNLDYINSVDKLIEYGEMPR